LVNTPAAIQRPPLTANQRARRQRIVDAALTLLESRDAGQIQVRDVAEAADVALGTVYHYFSSKEHLLAEALVQWAATLQTNITSRPLAGTTPAERLAETLRRSVRAFQRRPQLARLLSTLEVSTDPVAAEMLARLSETITAIYLDQLADLEPATAEAVTRVVQAVLATLIRSWSLGTLTINEVNRRLDEAVQLLLGPAE
jgi:TetR/AcrR family transcriptional regulator, cholesterol catabolism regulator